MTLAKGAVLARLLGLATIPILTRIYSPEDFGVMALYVALLAILAPILSLRYVQAIPLPRSDGLAFNLFYLCLCLITIGTGLIAFLLGCFSNELLGFFGMGALVPWVPFIVAGAFGTAFYELLSLWATRKKKYKIIAASQIAQSFFGNLSKILIGLTFFKAGGLIFGQLVSQCGGALRLTLSAVSDSRELKAKVSWKNIKTVASYYVQYPIYRLPSEVLAVASVQAPVLIMANLFDKSDTGQLSLAMAALSLPTNFIGAAISKAYYAEVASLGKRKSKEIREMTVSVQKRLFAIGLPIMVAAILFSGSLFSIFFGPEWEKAGNFAGILSPFILFQFTSSPLMKVINVVGSQSYILVLYSVRLVGLSGLYFLAKFWQLNSERVVFFISGYLSFFYIVMTVFILSVVYKSERKQSSLL